MTTDKRIDFGPLAVRTFDSDCFQQLWEIVAPPGWSIHRDPGLQHVLAFRPDGAWLNLDWIAVEEFSLTSPVETVSGPRDLPRDAKQRADDADSIRHRRPHDFTRWSAQLEVLKSAQKADQQPRIPFPFSACDLAAFMLHGPGAILADAFGGLRRREPDLRPIGGEAAAGTPKRGALCGAWTAIRLAEQEIGRIPLDAQQLTAALPKGAPNPSQTELDVAEADYKARFVDWRSRMANCLVGAGRPLLTHGGKDVWKEERSRAAREAANALHAPTRDAKRLVLKFWDEHRGTMNKEQAADAIAAMKPRLVSESRSTVRNWLKGA
jgi:hypothetical protein